MMIHVTFPFHPRGSAFGCFAKLAGDIDYSTTWGVEHFWVPLAEAKPEILERISMTLVRAAARAVRRRASGPTG